MLMSFENIPKNYSQNPPKVQVFFMSADVSFYGASYDFTAFRAPPSVANPDHEIMRQDRNIPLSSEAVKDQGRCVK